MKFTMMLVCPPLWIFKPLISYQTLSDLKLGANSNREASIKTKRHLWSICEASQGKREAQAIQLVFEI